LHGIQLHLLLLNLPLQLGILHARLLGGFEIGIVLILQIRDMRLDDGIRRQSRADGAGLFAILVIGSCRQRAGARQGGQCRREDAPKFHVELLSRRFEHFMI